MGKSLITIAVLVFIRPVWSQDQLFTDRAAWEAAVTSSIGVGWRTETFEDESDPTDLFQVYDTPFTTSDGLLLSSQGQSIGMQFYPVGAFGGDIAWHFREFQNRMEVFFPQGVAARAVGFDYRVSTEDWRIEYGTSMLPFPGGSMGFFGLIRPTGLSSFVLTSDATAQGGFFVHHLSFETGLLQFQRGDCNVDGSVNLIDPIVLLAWLFQGGEYPGCLDACDANDDGGVDLTDVTFNLFHLFGFGPPLPLPDSCLGVDPTPDFLGCGFAVTPCP